MTDPAEERLPEPLRKLLPVEIQALCAFSPCTRGELLSMRGVKELLLHLIETEGADGRLPLGSGLKSMAAELGVTHEALYRAVAELEKNGRLCRRENFLVAAGKG